MPFFLFQCCSLIFSFHNISFTGVPRTTQEEIDFGNFSIFDDPKRPYSTFKFTYTHIEFERISKLMEYNTLLSQETIFDNISVCIKRRRKFSIRRPCKSKDIARLSLKSRGKIEKLQQYIKMAEKLAEEAEQEEKKNRQLRKQAHFRPVSSPINFEEEQEEESEQERENVKNSKLQRSTVSLRPNMIRGKGMKPALSDVKENNEEKEEEVTLQVREKEPKRPLVRSKPISHRPMLDIDRRSGVSPFSTIEEEAAEANLSRRSSRDDTEVNYQIRSASPRDLRRERLIDIKEAKYLNGTEDSGQGNPSCPKSPEEDFVDARSLQEWMNTASQVTDL